MLSSIESRMKRLEPFMGNRVLEGVPFVVLLDGRNFTKIASKGAQPFDQTLANQFTEATKKIMADFSLPFAHTISDEVSFLFPASYKVYDRQVEKIISAVVSEFSAEMSLTAGKRMTFMGKVIALPSQELIREYFYWRYDLGYRNALLQTALHTPKVGRKDYHANYINSKIFQELIIDLSTQKVNFFELSNEFRRGSVFFWEHYKKDAFDPNKQENITVDRRRVVSVTDLPQHDRYDNFLKEKLSNIV